MENKSGGRGPGFEHVHSIEYVEANGLGGFACGTFSGANSRKYHGLLVASLQPPVERHVIVAKIDETIFLNGQYFHLGCNQFPGTLYPNGVQYLTSYAHDGFPSWIYNAEGITIKKTIASVRDENTTLVLYEVLNASEKFTFELQAFYSCRSIHSLSHANESIGKPFVFQRGIFRTMNYQGSPECFIYVPRSVFIEDQHWHRNFEYSEEYNRGLDFCEDLYSHGKFSVNLRKGAKLGVIVSLTDPGGRDAFRLFRDEKKRRQHVCINFAEDDFLSKLALAGDQFIVRRDDLNTIIAGYPWFSDWGRDTMISLTGLCLVTGRHKEAKRILQKFSEYVNEGMIPNRFPDTGAIPEYNTIDATLWYVHATYKYYRYTGDKLFLRNIMPVLRDIIDYHYKGTRFNIHVDPHDELVTGGEDGVQLTWMDAKVGDWVVTPRKGKTVEVNALWYNALRTMEFFMTELTYHGDADFYHLKANMVQKSFGDLFWNEAQKCLYDVVDGDVRDSRIRPNQLYAIGLPFAVLEGLRAIQVIDVVRKHLLTPRGLRSLSPQDPEYQGTYQGDIWRRDGAYHQGTVWSYLIGIYIDSLFATLGNHGFEEAVRLVNGFNEHLDEAGLGNISEIMDGDPPHKPRGSIAQAWGVAELLRVSVEYNLSETMRKKSSTQLPFETVS